MLAPLSKSNPNATPKSKFILSETTKSKPLAPKLGPTRSINPLQTPKPIKKVLPKSTKKGLSIYTPAWQDLQQEKEEGIEEVEHSHPKPLGALPYYIELILGLEDGPPTPIRDAFLAVADVLEGDLDPTEIDDPNWDDNFGLTLGMSSSSIKADNRQPSLTSSTLRIISRSCS